MDDENKISVKLDGIEISGAALLYEFCHPVFEFDISDRKPTDEERAFMERIKGPSATVALKLSNETPLKRLVRLHSHIYRWPFRNPRR